MSEWTISYTYETDPVTNSRPVNSARLVVHADTIERAIRRAGALLTASDRKDSYRITGVTLSGK